MEKKAFIYGLISFLILIIIWAVISYLKILPDFFLPNPKEVGEAIYILFTKYNFLKDILISFLRVLIGFITAGILGIPIGFLIALNKKSRFFIEPLVDFTRYTPLPAFIPLFILWFGIGELEKIVIVFFSVFFQIILMTENSISQTPKEIIDYVKTLGINKRDIILKVILPYSKPKIFNDLRVNIGIAWASVMLAEIVGATKGIGFVIIQSQRLLKTSHIFSALIIIGILGLAIDYFLRYLHKKLFAWT